MTQSQMVGWVGGSVGSGNRPVVEFVSCELNAFGGSKPLFRFSELCKELADDDAVPSIRIIVRAGSLSVLEKVMSELGVEDEVMT